MPSGDGRTYATGSMMAVAGVRKDVLLIVAVLSLSTQHTPDDRRCYDTCTDYFNHPLQ